MVAARLPRESGLEVGDPLLDRAGAAAHLEYRGSEEAASGEGAPLQVIEAGLAHRQQLSASPRAVHPAAVGVTGEQ
jgi:hypothetical protein